MGEQCCLVLASPPWHILFTLPPLLFANLPRQPTFALCVPEVLYESVEQQVIKRLWSLTMQGIITHLLSPSPPLLGRDGANRT